VIYLGHKEKVKFFKMLENGNSESSHFQGGQKYLVRKSPPNPDPLHRYNSSDPAFTMK